MKKLFLLFFLSFSFLILNAQSWLIEGKHETYWEQYDFPVEFEDGTFVVCYRTTEINQDGIGISRNRLEKRSHDGLLIKSKEISKQDTQLYLSNVLKLDDKIMYFFLSGRRLAPQVFENRAIIQLYNADLELLNESTLFVGDSSLGFGSFCIESDSTILLTFNVNSDYTRYFIRMNFNGVIKKINRYHKELGFAPRIIIRTLGQDSILGFDGANAFMIDSNLNPVIIKEVLNFFTTDSWGSICNFKNKYYLQLETYAPQGNEPVDIGLIVQGRNLDAIKVIRVGNKLKAKSTAVGTFYNPKAANSIYLAGCNYPPPLSKFNNPLIIARVDTNFNVLWTKFYDDNSYRDFPTIYATSDDGILLTGFRKDLTGQIATPIGYILKIDSSGNFPTANNDIKKDLLWSATVFPNPSSGLFTISIDDAAGDLSINLYDLNGCTVFTSQNLQRGKHSFDIRHIPDGFYNYSIFLDGKERATGKWIKN